MTHKYIFELVIITILVYLSGLLYQVRKGLKRDEGISRGRAGTVFVFL